MEPLWSRLCAMRRQSLQEVMSIDSSVTPPRCHPSCTSLTSETSAETSAVSSAIEADPPDWSAAAPPSCARQGRPWTQTTRSEFKPEGKVENGRTFASTRYGSKPSLCIAGGRCRIERSGPSRSIVASRARFRRFVA